MTFGVDDKGQTRAEYWLSKIYPLLETSGGMAFYGAITTATSTTQFKVSTLASMGTDVLNDAYYCQIIQADAAAPEGEIQKVSAYDTSDGDITVGAAFTIVPEVGDYVLILHESVVAAIANSTDNLFMKDVVGNKTDTSAIPSNTTSIVAMVKMIYASLSTTSPTAIGVEQVVSTTIDLNQAAATYTLLTGTTQAVTLEKLTLRVPNVDISGGALTSISIHTDDVTPAVIFNVADGDLANLTQEASLGWTGAIPIPVGTIIQLTIAGGAGGAACVCDITTQYRANVAGGILA